MLYQTLLSCQLEDLIDLEETKTLNINGSALLIGLVVVVRVDSLDLVELLKHESLQHVH